MKIRVPNSSMYINCLTAMGATPTGMPFSETISAVQQGVIDGLEGNMNAYSTNGSAEVCKNMSLTNHLVGTTNLGWGVPGMVVTSSAPATWYGVIRVFLQEP